MKRKRIVYGLVVMIVLGSLPCFTACENDSAADGLRDEDFENPDVPKIPETPVLIKWQYIKGGEFTMGNENPEFQEENQAPAHRVRLSSFWMSRTEVTFDQYNAFLKAVKGTEVGKRVEGSGNDEEKWGMGQRPVVNVSYEDAMEFCKWAGVDLPTEAQWEYACRAGTTGKFSFPDDDDPIQRNTHMWYGENSRDMTHPVATRQPNPWGLYDMHGNVVEWVKDWGDNIYYEDCNAEGVVVDPPGPLTGRKRIVRGGNWFDGSFYCRSATRLGEDPKARSYELGFRVVVPIPDK